MGEGAESEGVIRREGEQQANDANGVGEKGWVSKRDEGVMEVEVEVEAEADSEPASGLTVGREEIRSRRSIVKVSLLFGM